MKNIQYIILFFGLVILSGCKKYLSEEPRKLASIKTAEQLEALVNNAVAFSYENNLTASFSSDDTEISQELYRKNPTRFIIDQIQYYVSAIDGVKNLTEDNLWTGEYKKIFTANLILANIDEVSGSESVRRQVKADALFIRAYSYWVLANHYCAPYTSGNLSALGLPLKKTVDYEEALKRATLGETYEMIISDVTQAQSLAQDDVDPAKPWRISKKGISAFLSRYYLFIGNYDLSITQADIALSTTSAKLVDFNTIKAGNSATYQNPAVTLRYLELNDWTAARFLYWPEFYYTRYTYNVSQWFNPSPSLLSIYDAQNDMRFKGLFIANGGRFAAVSDPASYRYTVFNRGSYIPSGPTVAEVLLNKAEALARKGDASGAMAAANLLRQKRMSTYVALTATDGASAINNVLLERRREMPFSMRWYDMRRLNVNDNQQDNITVTRNFFNVSAGIVDVNSPRVYTLEAKRFLVPINGIDIDASKGQIEQNQY